MLGAVISCAEEMKRDVRRIADDPGIVTRGNGKDVSRRKNLLGAVSHPQAGFPRDHEADMLDLAEKRAGLGADVLGPSPARLVGGSTQQHSAHADDLELALRKSV